MLFCRLLTLIVAAAAVLPATPMLPYPSCPNGSLTLYTAPCSVGAVGILNMTVSGIPASDVQVIASSTPMSGTLMFIPANNFAGSGMRRSYTISYSADPHPIIWSFELEMETSTPIAPGCAAVNTQLVLSTPLATVPSACTAPGTPTTLRVFHDGTNSDLIESVTFPLDNFVQVSNLAVLDGGPAGAGGSADFTSFRNTFYVVEDAAVPEPRLWPVITLALIAGWLRHHRRVGGRARR